MIAPLEAVLGLVATVAAIVQANKHDARVDAWWRGVPIILGGMLGLWIVISVVLSVAPVISDARIKQVIVTPGEILLVLTGNKTRDCQWITTDAYVVDQHDQLTEASLTYPDDRIKGNSRPIGLLTAA